MGTDLEIIQERFLSGVGPLVKDSTRVSTDIWQEPLPLTSTIEAVPYPLDALPDIVRTAVEEVHTFSQAPVPLVASSALSAMSLAIQAHVDVKRSDGLTGPVGLFSLTIADSGERKTSSDRFFTQPIQEYERDQLEQAKPDLKRYTAAHAAWSAEREGILTAIKQAAKSGRATGELTNRLTDSESRQPVAPRIPQLLRGDDTPEHLAYSLAKHWPSAGVLVSEAGLVFGAHGMGPDSMMRNLALLNTLWDGGTHHVGRRTSESFTVRGARLTMGLQVQEATLRTFFEKSGTLARGTGFLARFLLSWPDSTQGFRPFREPPHAWPALESFRRRIADILHTPVPIDDAGALSPTLLSLSPEAKGAWVAFHDAIEAKLRTGGELYDVRDVASKIADNAARLAALFQFFCSNCSSSSVAGVRAEDIESAIPIVAWHLNESRRFFGELTSPAELTDPAKLDAWLLKYCHEHKVSHVSTRTVLQYGPTKLRRKAELLAAAGELVSLYRVRIFGEGNRTIIEMNPALLKVSSTSSSSSSKEDGL